MLDVIATPVATVLRGIHAMLSAVLAPGSGPAWALSIVLLTVVVRLLLFPLFVKQIKSQRRMQELAPRIKDIQRLHKGDRETLQAETMKLYRENNANPLSGCLPLLLQLPVFFALFTLIREFKPGATAKYGLSAQDLEEGGRERVFGAPISAALNSSAEEIARLGADVGTVRVVAVVMLVLIGATTFWLQRQMMVRAAATTDPMQMQVQRVLLYVLPVSFAVFGYNFPIGVLLYWLTTNVWSMGQQAYVIKRMPPPVLGSTTGGSLIGGAPRPYEVVRVQRAIARGASLAFRALVPPRRQATLDDCFEQVLSDLAVVLEGSLPPPRAEQGQVGRSSQAAAPRRPRRRRSEISPGRAQQRTVRRRK